MNNKSSFIFHRSFFILHLEFEGGGVDAVAEAGGGGAVGEDVAEVGAAMFAGDFGANHAVSEIPVFGNRFLVEAAVETWPAAAGIEFAVGIE